MMGPASGRYLRRGITNIPCAALQIDPTGLASSCDSTPVWLLRHSWGKSIALCELHIEFFWNYVPPFRAAVRDIWAL